jgi:hypothetical protein
VTADLMGNPIIPLQYAMQHKQHEMVLLLLSAGADFPEENKKYSKAEVEEIEKYRKEEFATFLGKTTSLLETDTGLPKDILRTVLEYTYGFSKPPPDIEKEINAAIKEGNLESIEALLKTLNSKMPKKLSSELLSSAIEKGSLDIIKLLMNYGVTLTGGYSNALELAIEFQNLDLVNFFLDQNVPFHTKYLDSIVNHVKPFFETPEKQAIFKVLLDRATFVFHFNARRERYAYDNLYCKEAIKMGHIECLKKALAQKEIVFRSEWIEEAIKCNQLKIAELFLNYAKEHEPPINTWLDEKMDQFSHTSLHYAVKNNQHEMVQLLLREGATFGTKEYSKEEAEELEKYKKEMSRHKETVALDYTFLELPDYKVMADNQSNAEQIKKPKPK